jgi:hypothetical protein
MNMDPHISSASKRFPLVRRVLYRAHEAAEASRRCGERSGVARTSQASTGTLDVGSTTSILKRRQGALAQGVLEHQTSFPLHNGQISTGNSSAE